MGTLRWWILGSMIGGGLLLALAGFAGGMWAVLCVLGDEVGAGVAGGVAAVIAGGFLLTQILLVTLLALAFLQKNMEGEAFTDATRHV